MTFLNRKSHVLAILKLYDRRFGTSRLSWLPVLPSDAERVVFPAGPMGAFSRTLNLS